MCGYFFAISPSGNSLNFRSLDLDDACRFIKKRGKDYFSCEKYCGESILAGHARLAIQGLGDSGKQPMLSNNGQFLLLFNGEIYNHLELRKRYFSHIRTWLSSSDAETILALVEELGFTNTIDKLNGMYSIVVYDFFKKKIYAAIDKFGEKPLYYHIDKDLIIFANNLDSLRSLSRNIINIDQLSLETFFEIGYIPAPKTIFSNVNKLCPGEYAEIGELKSSAANIVKITRYYDPKSSFTNCNLPNINSLNEEVLVKKLDFLLESAIDQASISDVPFCTTLSGGIDSGLLNYYLSRNIDGLDSYHLLCDDFGHNEYKRASSISKKLGVNLNVVELSTSNIEDGLEVIAEAYDEPFADSSQIPTLFLSKEIAKNYKVCLTGDGLDELFSGYNRHVFLPKLSKSLLRFPGSIAICKSIKYYLSTQIGRQNIKYLNTIFANDCAQVNYGEKLKKLVDIVSRSSSSELRDLYSANIRDGINLLSNKNQSAFNPDFLKSTGSTKKSGDIILCYADLKNYLPNDILVKTDRASMYYSLEMRAPYLNCELLDFAANVPSNLRIRKGKGKYLLRKIFSERIDEDIGQNAKTGFSIPIGKYINNIYNRKICQLINDKPFENIINYDVVKNIWSAHLSGDYENTQTIWRYLCFIIWSEKRGLS